MLELFNGLRGITLQAVALRMILVFACGGLIGIEREYKRRAAGFRTHILICLGAAMTTLTSEFLLLQMNYYTDIGRIGAQVVAGIGFIGAGCIIVTKRSRVKGLTTAAGLWAAAIVGLALGAGFYEGGLCATALILIAELFFSKLEYFISSKSYEANLFMEYENKTVLDTVLKGFQQMNIRISNLEITKNIEDESKRYCATFTILPKRNHDIGSLILMISSMEGVLSVEEI